MMNVPTEKDFWNYSPEGVHINANRIKYFGFPNKEDLQAMEPLLAEAAAFYKGLPQDCIVFTCTTGSLIGGKDYNQHYIGLLERRVEALGLPQVQRYLSL